MRDTRPCVCDHTAAAHRRSWGPALSCHVVWCACPRYRSDGRTVGQRWREWRQWRRDVAAWRREHATAHRLDRRRR